MNKFTMLFESFDPVEKQAIFNRIKSLTNWLYKSNGLGMMNIIDQIFNEKGWRQRIPHESIAKFNNGLELLYKTSMSKQYIQNQLRKKLPGGINNATSVQVDGDWDFVNKLNTNYVDLADLLSELVMLGKEKNPEKGQIVYNDIIQNPQSGLLKLKPHLKRLLEKYFPNLDDYRKFTKYTKERSQIGEESEDKIVELLNESGIEVVYRGGNGDSIDMIFGTDIICWSKHYGYKTIQVKSTIYWDSVDYYQVDWIAEGTSKKIFDKKTRKEVDLFPGLQDVFDILNKS